MDARSRTLAAVGAAALALAGTATAASAAPMLQERIEDSYEFVDDDFCGTGTTVLVEGGFSARLLAVEQGRDRLAHFSDRTRGEVLFTTLDDAGEPVPGLTAREVGTFATRDLHVVDNGDGTLSIRLLSTGNLTWYGPDGKAVGRNPGQIRLTFLVDHGGTPQDPFDDETIDVGDVDFGSTGRTDDFCDSLVPVLVP
ncbi:hypothetical protein [Aquipuribacter sp. SD81]|uniref:hypothetical protein n=1 Tax=Aquipuribacter sp. SD81 TaxID=3127703 RepID=UPI0030161E86